MIDTPRDVCLHEGLLRWSLVSGADGYNIHAGELYIGTVTGSTNSFTIDESTTLPPYSVSAWVKGSGGNTAHTPRSAPASALFQPAGALAYYTDFSQPDEAWLTRFPYWDRDLTINNELQRYEADRVVYDSPLIGRGVRLQADRYAADGLWRSGILAGDPEVMSRLYGFFEMRMRLPVERVGLLPAWWLLNEKYVGQRPEIDVVEAVGDSIYQSYHSWEPERNSRSFSYPRPADEGFHDYGVLWEPDRLTWYTDRVPTASTYGDHVSSQPAYPIVNLAVGGNWPGSPSDTLIEAHLDVEWYAAYEL